MIKVAELPLAEDLAPLYTYMLTQRVPIRIVEAGGHQEIWVQDERLKDLTLQILERYRKDPSMREQLSTFHQDVSQQIALATSPKWSDWMISFWRVPVTWSGLIAMVVITLLMWFVIGEPLLNALSITATPVLPDTDYSHRLAALQAMLASGQWWRLLTPALLHFSPMHLIFNGVMFWYLGIRIERFHGSKLLLSLLLLTALGSNIGQFLVFGSEFGGMSGAIYGFFGYCGWYGLRHPNSGVGIRQSLFIFALVWLVLGYTALPQLLGGAELANTAHLAGLLLGLLFAWVRDQVLHRPS